MLVCDWFQFAVEVAAGSEEPLLPCTCSRQVHRSNIEVTRIMLLHLTIPFLDYLNQELEHRFSSNARIATLGVCLVPDVMRQVDDCQNNVKNLALLYQGDIPAPLSLETELHCWQNIF